MLNLLNALIVKSKAVIKQHHQTTSQTEQVTFMSLTCLTLPIPRIKKKKKGKMVGDGER